MVPRLPRLASQCYRFAPVPCPSPSFSATPSSSATPSTSFFSAVRALHTTSPCTMPVAAYTSEERGVRGTTSYRVFLRDSAGAISPFHDIPYRAGANTFHAVIEVPRWSNAKMEVDTCSTLNPIKQDVKKGKVRYVANSFPHHGYIWNYGAIPQTWESPRHTDPATGCGGDNDPIDVCEIGERVANRGDVVEVKVLGVLAMVDDGETDWKVMVIDVTDPLADKLNNMEDVDREMPGFKEATREWFRVYKMPDGKPENSFGLKGEFQGPEFAVKVIEETHGFWRSLVEGGEEAGGLATGAVLAAGAKVVLARGEAEQVVAATAAVSAGPPAPEGTDKIHFVHLKH